MSELASSFGSAAQEYAAHRPDYARAAVDWVLEAAPGRRVLDLGAGTGKLTAALVALGVDAVAVEPDLAMLDQLRAAHPSVAARPGSAEAIPLPDGSVDAVVAGNALHWFDFSVAGPEIARVLTPGGVLAGMWNVVDDSVDWVAGLVPVAGPEVIGPRDTPASCRAVTTALLPGGDQAEFAHHQRRTADSLVATLATRAGVLVMSPAEREARLTVIRDYLASRPETAQGGFDLPMLTSVVRTRSVPGS